APRSCELSVARAKRAHMLFSNPEGARIGRDRSCRHRGVHFVGGVVGVLLIGFLATEVMTGGARGLFYGGGFAQLGKQALGVPGLRPETAEEA
ncbi:MAG TPA: hypothetical protein VH166_06200, partial [Mycobacterium sp.]|nr:hypothetical protein [Mycobacterium sp.]